MVLLSMCVKKAEFCQQIDHVHSLPVNSVYIAFNPNVLIGYNEVVLQI